MTRADAAARALSDRFHIDASPVDLDMVASELGIIVVQQPAAASVNGMLIRREDRDAMGLNDKLRHENQRFTLAHLLCHHQIHRRRDLILDVANRYQIGNLASMPTDREEAEANRFAGALLMPEATVRHMAAEADFDTAAQLVELLAPRFEVSRAVMGYRLMSLGIILDV